MSTNNGPNGVLELFRKAAWEIDQKKLDTLEMDAKISDLGIDSVAMLEIVGYLEEELDVQLPDEKLARVQTLRDLSNLVEGNSPKSARAGA